MGRRSEAIERFTEEAEYRLEDLPVQRVLQVLDGVELDATLLEQVEGAP